MHTRSRLLFGAAFAAAALVAGCSTKVCTTRGCQDQYRVTIANADGTVPPGLHVVEVTADGATSSCTLGVVAGVPSTAPQCSSGLQVLVGQESDCVESTQGNAKVLTCTPIPGRFFEDITVSGRPTQVRVLVTVDGTAILDRTEILTYEETKPNGPDCDPTCHQASAKWAFSAP